MFWDLGCGLGALVFDAARRGAARVVGIEILDEFTQANNRAWRRSFHSSKTVWSFARFIWRTPGLKNSTSFSSKDSFEHILELEEHLAQMKAHLNPQGRIDVGFAPLFIQLRGATTAGCRPNCHGDT